VAGPAAKSRAVAVRQEILEIEIVELRRRTSQRDLVGFGVLAAPLLPVVRALTSLHLGEGSIPEIS
jgi:hypothetical protein